MLTFDGFKGADFYGWLNPELPHAEKYSHERLLSHFCEVTEETYNDFLNMMPPHHFTSSGFSLCEATTANIRLAFYRVESRYFATRIADRDNVHNFAATYTRIADAVRLGLEQEADDPCFHFQSDGRGCCRNCGHFHGKTEG